jgi:hypothetical protein
MKRNFSLMVIIASLIFLSTTVASAYFDYYQPSIPTKQSFSYGGVKVLCSPGVYLGMITDCSSIGPSDYLNSLAEKNISLPILPFPASKPDFNLTYPNVAYGQLRSRNSPVYGSLEDALKGKKSAAINRIDAAFAYISYIDEAVIDGKRFYMVAPGAWMTANDVIRVSAPRFQGYTFTDTPSLPFGWVLTYLSRTPQVETKRSPGYETNDYTGHLLKNHEIVWVYDSKEINGYDWYMVGLDEWVPQNVVSRVIPRSHRPEGIPIDRYIEINLYEQTIAVYNEGELIFATLIASGLDPFWTRPGLFQIYEMLESTPMRGAFEADGSDAYYLEDVPWTMYFDEKRAIHGAYWRANLGFPQSHGCVNLSIGDAQWIYMWAQPGDWVYVWDPSGNTPTNPDEYTAGGA